MKDTSTVLLHHAESAPVHALCRHTAQYTTLFQPKQPTKNSREPNPIPLDRCQSVYQCLSVATMAVFRREEALTLLVCNEIHDSTMNSQHDSTTCCCVLCSPFVCAIGAFSMPHRLFRMNIIQQMAALAPPSVLSALVQAIV